MTYEGTPAERRFSVGVLDVTWDESPVANAVTIAINTPTGTMPTDDIRKALQGVVIREPSGTYSHIQDVEMFATFGQRTGAKAVLTLAR